MQDGSLIYQQILLFIKRGVIVGTIKDGDELPSRRVLSALLGVNPNTVQKDDPLCRCYYADQNDMDWNGTQLLYVTCTGPEE